MCSHCRGRRSNCRIFRAADDRNFPVIQSRQTGLQRIRVQNLRNEAALATILEESAHRQRQIYPEIRSRDVLEICKLVSGPRSGPRPVTETNPAVLVDTPWIGEDANWTSST